MARDLLNAMIFVLCVFAATQVVGYDELPHPLRFVLCWSAMFAALSHFDQLRKYWEDAGR